jgi:trimethylamine monooxygenase
MTTTRVAVIGAGPSGLSQLIAFESNKAKQEYSVEVVCFEKQSSMGGLWNYTWRTGLDGFGEPVHGSMYKNLFSNGPKEALEVADYTFDEHFKRSIPSYPPRVALLDYICARANKYDLKPHIRFNSVVRNVSYHSQDNSFLVVVNNMNDNISYSERFDYVIVATGHFSVPHAPQLSGIESFEGRVLHSHDFRNACEFRGKNVLVVGSSYSAEDIALQCYEFGTKSVVISYRSKPMSFHWPEGIIEVPIVTKIEGNIAYFIDGTNALIDVIILCTGYKHHFPFLDDTLKLNTTNRFYPPNLYKGLFYKSNHKLIYVGMQDQYFTFNMFDVQAWYVRDVILGKIVLPPVTPFQESDIDNDINKWLELESQILNEDAAIDFQALYMKDLMKYTDYPMADIQLDLMSNMLKEWHEHKHQNILTYRDKCFVSAFTNSIAVKMNDAWEIEVKKNIDSVEDFLKLF